MSHDDLMEKESLEFRHKLNCEQKRGRIKLNLDLFLFYLLLDYFSCVFLLVFSFLNDLY